MDDVNLALRALRDGADLFLQKLDFIGYEQWLWVCYDGFLLLLLYVLVRCLFLGWRAKKQLLPPSVEQVTETRWDPAERVEEAGEAQPEVPVRDWVTARTAGPFSEEPEESFFSRLKARLSKTQDQFAGRLDRMLLLRKSVDTDVLEDLEEVLLTADLGTRTSYELLAEVQKEVENRTISPAEMKRVLREKMRWMLHVDSKPLDVDRVRPLVVMIVGVNGVGKTTTAGKLAARLGKGRKKVMLVAADTFRPAAIEQLHTWSIRVGADFIRHQPGADPSAVVFDAISAAKSRESDLVLVDTAGRLHTKKNLVEELKKIKRVIGRQMQGAPHEILLVLDATTGQNAIHQARIFHEALGVTGIVLTKLDGTAKGGIIIGIANELQLPVRFVGIGEEVQDLREFNPCLFLDAILGDGESTAH